VSELRKGARANKSVLHWFEAVEPNDLYVSVLVLGELQHGVESVRRRDPRSAIHLERWLKRLAEDYAERLLPVDAAVAELWGRLNVPDPLPAVDSLMAATALVHDLTFVTRDQRDIRGTGVATINPFTA
jgi:predicted nucleic acid-binding protein